MTVMDRFPRYVEGREGNKQMTSREIYNLIQTGNSQSMQQALFEMLALTQELATATLEIAHKVKQQTGREPLSSRPRLWLSEFLELPKEQK